MMTGARTNTHSRYAEYEASKHAGLVLAILDVFQMIIWSVVVMLPLVFCCTKKPSDGELIAVAAE